MILKRIEGLFQDKKKGTIFQSSPFLRFRALIRQAGVHKEGISSSEYLPLP